MKQDAARLCSQKSFYWIFVYAVHAVRAALLHCPKPLQMKKKMKRKHTFWTGIEPDLVPGVHQGCPASPLSLPPALPCIHAYARCQAVFLWHSIGGYVSAVTSTKGTSGTGHVVCSGLPWYLQVEWGCASQHKPSETRGLAKRADTWRHKIVGCAECGTSGLLESTSPVE